MRGSGIVRELRKLNSLTLRCETIQHIAFHNVLPHTLNRLVAADPALALALVRRIQRPGVEQDLTIAQLAEVAQPGLLAELIQLNNGGILPTVTQESHDRVWRHSIAVAHAARQIARTEQYPNPDTAYLSGLLHNLGLIALAVADPKGIETVLVDEDDDTLLQLEEDYYGSNHLTIGRRLAERWGLPLWLRNVIWWHHHSKDSLPARLSHRTLVQIVNDANREVARSGFALGVEQSPNVTSPWECQTNLSAGIARGVLQTITFLHDTPTCEVSDGKLLEVTIDMACENQLLNAEMGWRRAALDSWVELSPYSSPAEVLPLIAETLQDSLSAHGVMCYTVDDETNRAEACFKTIDSEKEISFELLEGKDAESNDCQLLNQLPSRWRSRPHRSVEIAGVQGIVGHMILWLGEVTTDYQERSLHEAVTLAAAWLQCCTHTESLTGQTEQLAAELRHQAKSAETTLEESKLDAVAELAAGAGHEINNPLAVISGRAQLLMSDESDEQRKQSLQIIADQSKRIHRMIVDLMAFARPTEPGLKSVSIVQLFTDTMGQMNEMVEGLDIKLTQDINDESLNVECDASQIITALKCLVQNSIDALQDGGTIELHAKAHNESIQLSVVDNGPGIPTDIMPNVMDPFFSGRDAGRGLGMGLPKAWRIAQINNGKLHLDSTPQGTRVTLELQQSESDSDETQRDCA